MQYARMKKIEKYDTVHEEQLIEKPEPFTPFELLAGYISHYSLFDLFFREFRYTVDDLSRERDFSLLFDILSEKTLDLDMQERLKIITLSIEQSHPDDDRAFTEKACIDLIKQLHTTLLVQERKRILQNLEPAEEEYRRQNLAFILKARSL